jgi:DNA-3-methyladenine glycosylase
MAPRKGHSEPEIRPLARRELPIDTEKLARFLVGKTLVRDRPEGRSSGRIVETEAYVLGDAASHAFRGPTPRNRAMYLERGHAYVYFIYGVSYMLNVSSEKAGIGAGVLLRAIEPLQGIHLMAARRGTERLRDLARGPGRLAQAMAIDPSVDGVDLCAEGAPLWLGAPMRTTGPVGASVRIGITRDAERVLRFFELNSVYVSGARRLNRVEHRVLLEA